jgi:LysR family transcriptional regulator, cys regulon transcriptional activator
LPGPRGVCEGRHPFPAVARGADLRKTGAAAVTALTLTGLRCLVAIVDAGLNLSAAGEALHLSQPTVSRQLGQVEQALGFRVFVRHGRSLAALTPAGAQVLAVARRVLRELDQLRPLVADLRGDAPGELSIAAPQGYVLHILPPLLRTLRGRYPGLGVRVRTLGEGERLRPGEHEHGDIVLLSTAGDERPEAPAIPLFRWRRVAIVERDHPLAAHRGTLGLDELARWPLITYEASRQPTSSFSRVMAAAGLSPRFAVSAQDVDTLKAYTRAGLGVGVVADFSLLPDDRDDVVVLEVDPRLPDCTAWASLPRGRMPRHPTLDLLRLLAPQIDVERLRRGVDGLSADDWPSPPTLPRQA